MTNRTALQQIATDLKKHLLDIEDHASALKKRIFDFEKQITGVEADEELGSDRAAARSVSRYSTGDDRMRPFRFLEQIGCSTAA
jgi:hypothetical protein